MPNGNTLYLYCSILQTETLSGAVFNKSLCVEF